MESEGTRAHVNTFICVSTSKGVSTDTRERARQRGELNVILTNINFMYHTVRTPMFSISYYIYVIVDDRRTYLEALHHSFPTGWQGAEEWVEERRVFGSSSILARFQTIFILPIVVWCDAQFTWQRVCIFLSCNVFHVFSLKEEWREWKYTCYLNYLYSCRLYAWHCIGPNVL